MRTVFISFCILLTWIGSNASAQTYNVVNVRPLSNEISLGSSARFQFTRSGDTSSALTVAIWTSIPDGLVSNPPTEVVFNARESSKTITLQTNRNAILDPHFRQIYVGLEGGNYDFGTNFEAFTNIRTTTIRPTIDFDRASAVITEGDPIPIIVYSDRLWPDDINVRLYYSNNTAGRVRTTGTDQTITIPAGQYSGHRQINSTRNTVQDGTGTLTAHISSRSEYQIGSPNRFAVSVEDGGDTDPEITVSVSRTAYTEGQSFTYTFRRPSTDREERTIHVEVHETGDMLAPNMAMVHGLRFARNATSIGLRISTIRDDVYEDASYVTARIRTRGSGIVSYNPTATVEVQDSNSRQRVRLASADGSTQENSSYDLTLERDASTSGLDQELEVHVRFNTTGKMFTHRNHVDTNDDDVADTYVNIFPTTATDMDAQHVCHTRTCNVTFQPGQYKLHFQLAIPHDGLHTADGKIWAQILSDRDYVYGQTSYRTNEITVKNTDLETLRITTRGRDTDGDGVWDTFVERFREGGYAEYVITRTANDYPLEIHVNEFYATRFPWGFDQRRRVYFSTGQTTRTFRYQLPDDPYVSDKHGPESRRTITYDTGQTQQVHIDTDNDGTPDTYVTEPVYAERLETIAEWQDRAQMEVQYTIDVNSENYTGPDHRNPEERSRLHMSVPISDNDVTTNHPVVSITRVSSQTRTEGQDLQFRVSRTGGTQWALDTYVYVYEEGNDISDDLASIDVTIPKGRSSQAFTIQTFEDQVAEEPNSITISLGHRDHYYRVHDRSNAVGFVLNNKATTTDLSLYSHSGTSVVEGRDARFRLTRNRTAGRLRANIVIEENNDMFECNDETLAALNAILARCTDGKIKATVEFRPGVSTLYLNVKTIDDLVNEFDSSLMMYIEADTNTYGIASGRKEVTISVTDNDAGALPYFDFYLTDEAPTLNGTRLVLSGNVTLGSRHLLKGDIEIGEGDTKVVTAVLRNGVAGVNYGLRLDINSSGSSNDGNARIGTGHDIADRNAKFTFTTSSYHQSLELTPNVDDSTLEQGREKFHILVAENDGSSINEHPGALIGATFHRLESNFNIVAYILEGTDYVDVHPQNHEIDVTEPSSNQTRNVLVLNLENPRQRQYRIQYRIYEDDTLASAATSADFTPKDWTTLTWTANQSSQQREVPVELKADELNDDGEQFRIQIRPHPSDTAMWVRVGTGYESKATTTFLITIKNDDPIPDAYLARFGRTVASQTVDAIFERVKADRVRGFTGTVAGQEIRPRTRHEALTFDVKEDNDITLEDEAILDTEFELAQDTDNGGFLAIWSLVSHNAFKGRAKDIAVEGEATTLFLGTDYAHENWMLGLAFSQSWGEGFYPGLASHVETALFSVIPYASYDLGDTLTVWGALGYGSGDMSLTYAESDHGTDITWRMAAFGSRYLLTPERHDYRLFLVSDAFASNIKSAPVPNLSATQSQTSRVRVGLESEWDMHIAERQFLTPEVSLHLQHDSGDADEGFGMTLGAGLTYRDLGRGLFLDLDWSSAMTHEDESYKEWGVGLSLTYDRRPHTRRGFFARLSSDMNRSEHESVLFSERNVYAKEEGDTWTFETSYGYGRRHGRVGSPYLEVDDDDKARLGYRLESDKSYADDLTFATWFDPRTDDDKIGVSLDYEW